jgi:hypothetical protein
MELNPEDFKQTFAEKEGKAGWGQRYALKSVSQADKVELDEVVISPVDDVIAGLGEYSDIGRKSVFESTADSA